MASAAAQRPEAALAKAANRNAYPVSFPDRKRMNQMFLDGLSRELLKICGERKITYKTASKMCHMSRRHFQNIISKKTSPSLDKIESCCIAFDKTPNEMLGIASDDLAAILLEAMPVQIDYSNNDGEEEVITSCPRCQYVAERRMQPHCSECGQRLAWETEE